MFFVVVALPFGYRDTLLPLIKAELINSNIMSINISTVRI